MEKNKASMAVIFEAVRESDDLEMFLKHNRNFTSQVFLQARRYMSVNEISELLGWGNHFNEFVSGSGHISEVKYAKDAKKLFDHVRKYYHKKDTNEKIHNS